MTAPNVYALNSLVRLTNEFTQAAGGSPIDPTDVLLYVEDPTGTEQTYQYSLGQIIRDSLGNYHYVLNLAISGTWTYRWQGTGAAPISTDDINVYVNASELVTG